MLSLATRRPTHSQTGFTLVELLVAVVVLAILAAAAIPNARAWIQSAQIRTASESIVSGLQLARATAVTRNTTTQFVLCGTDSTWSVMAASAAVNTTACGAAAIGWELIQSRMGAEGTRNATVTTTQNTFAFNGLGQLTTAMAGNINIDVKNPTGGTCVTTGGTMKCMRVVVFTGGQIRLCNPAFSQNTNPQGC